MHLYRTSIALLSHFYRNNVRLLFTGTVSVQNSLQPSYIMQAAARARIAAEAGELEKDIRHNSLVSASSSVFHPPFVESLGLWTAHSLKILKTIARKLTFHNVSS